MKKIYRIKKNTEIEQLVKKKKSVGNKYFVMYYLPAKESHFRYCVSVSKKYGKAVDRNLAKRRVRAIIASQAIYFANLDFLVAIKPIVKGLSFGEMNQELLRLFIKSGILKERKN